MKTILVALAISLATCGDVCASNLDSLLNSQRTRAGQFAGDLFEPFTTDKYTVAPERLEDYRFLLANLPLADLAQMSSGDLLDNVRLARFVRASMPWGESIPEDIYRHFVLPHRISQEPFTKWRGQFMQELLPRVGELSMEAAALEVNVWCHEQATYKPSDGRDADPLTTIRTGHGRCEEEMILAIAALRSVGIPVRQCYTPYWAHMDDNHAWVEVWVDGRWYYLGACEPALSLNNAWFTQPAQRAMMVVSSAFGNYEGDEPVLRRYGRSTNLNSTAVYGETRDLTVRLVDIKGKPVGNSRVIFSLFNYGGWMPAAGLETDKAGAVTLTCGMGDWFISAGSEKSGAMGLAKAGENEVVLKLMKNDRMELPEVIEYSPPPKVETQSTIGAIYSAEGEARGVIDCVKVVADSLFSDRMKVADSVRNAGVWAVWAREMGAERRAVEPDSVVLSIFCDTVRGIGIDPEEFLELFRKARGNWGTLYFFVTGVMPFFVGNDGEAELTPLPEEFPIPEFVQNKLLLLKTLSEKDLRDFNVPTLRDHYNYTTISVALQDLLFSVYLDTLDSLAAERVKDYVITPRIDYEPSLPWRQALGSFLDGRLDLVRSKNDGAMIAWVKKNITIEESIDRLGPPLTPAQTLALRRGTEGDIARLYVGLCRVRGIPARFNPVSGGLERWGGDEWVNVDLSRKKEVAKSVRKGELSIEVAADDSVSQAAVYLRDWCLSRWDNERLAAIDLGWRKPYSAMTFPVELPEGRYCLTSGKRREDGSATVQMMWVQVKKGKAAEVRLSFGD